MILLWKILFIAFMAVILFGVCILMYAEMKAAQRRRERVKEIHKRLEGIVASYNTLVKSKNK